MPLDPISLAAYAALQKALLGHMPTYSTTYLVHVQDPGQEPPIRDVYITVNVPRLRRATSDTGTGTKRTQEDINKFGGGGGDVKNVTKTSAGVTEDSSGQQHVRGEHTEITYVVDGVPLPDTLSGRQGAIVVSSTIESVDVVLGGFAPEFGIQTAAILDITTLPRAKKFGADLDLTYGGFSTRNAQLTAMSPVGSKFGYVLNLASNKTDRVSEPQQPDRQAAHNHGEDENAYGKFTYQASARDRLALTLSTNPSRSQIGNRTGLPDSFAQAGQGFGFQGLRNRDGSIPGISPDGTLGSGNMLLADQDAAGMDINQKESNEFATFTWRHTFDEKSTGLFGLVFLHSGQDVFNNNPFVDVLNLPVDSSIEYNPTASRNVHHVQVNGTYSTRSGAHSLKAGFLYDKQSGDESYRIEAASQLALDGLAALAPELVPAGATNGETDVYGNPVYVPTSGTTPTLHVQRDGHYAGFFLQDTWRMGKRFTVNYGLRFDNFRQTQNLGQAAVDKSLVSPRLNLSYAVDKSTTIRASYDKLFNTPPLAQGAILGEPLQPPIVDQYDLSIEKQITPYQSVKLAYYTKDIRNQIDVGLLVPGSEIGLYSGVNLERGGVHGLEFSYDITAKGGVGWDGYFNYTLSAAKPNGLDNTGEEVDDYNDHDQRQTVGFGLAYTWKSGFSAAMTLQHGSGLASSAIPPSTSRTPRTSVDLHLTTGDRLFNGKGGLSLDIDNIFDRRDVINFQSAFSGTRFQSGRTVSLTASFKF